MQTETSIGIRWMIRRDFPAVLAIERRCPFPWDEEMLLAALRQRTVIAHVAYGASHDERQDAILGYVIYELCPNRIHMLRLVVSPDFRRRGVGRAIVEKMKAKLTVQKRRALLIDCRESELEGQLFCREMGFHAVRVLRGHFRDSGEDAYRFVFNVDWDARWAAR